MADLLFILFGFNCFAYICRMNNSFTCLVTYIQTNQTGGLPWSCLVVGDEGWISPSRKLLCLCYTQKIYATHAWHTSILVWLLGRSSCSSPSTKELHDIVICLTAKNASVLDGIPGLLDMGGDCRSRGREFESWYIV